MLCSIGQPTLPESETDVVTASISSLTTTTTTLTLRTTMHSVTDRQTDDITMPIANHTM